MNHKDLARTIVETIKVFHSDSNRSTLNTYYRPISPVTISINAECCGRVIASIALNSKKLCTLEIIKLSQTLDVRTTLPVPDEIIDKLTYSIYTSELFAAKNIASWREGYQYNALAVLDGDGFAGHLLKLTAYNTLF